VAQDVVIGALLKRQWSRIHEFVAGQLRPNEVVEAALTEGYTRGSPHLAPFLAQVGREPVYGLILTSERLLLLRLSAFWGNPLSVESAVDRTGVTFSKTQGRFWTRICINLHERAPLCLQVPGTKRYEVDAFMLAASEAGSPRSH
jgi:hypothetical protein